MRRSSSSVSGRPPSPTWCKGLPPTGTPSAITAGHIPFRARKPAGSAAPLQGDRTHQCAILAATGLKPCLFRPPGGIVKGARKATRAAGLSMILWSTDPRDWAASASKKSASVIRKRVAAGTERATSGDLASRRRWQPIGDSCRAARDHRRLPSTGYQFVTLTEPR